MHEMSITLSMIDIVTEEMEKRGVERLERLKIRVGELTAVEPQSLLFCFDVCTKDTPLEGAVLDIEEVPLMGTCMDCNEEFHRSSTWRGSFPSAQGAKGQGFPRFRVTNWI
jgi:hydrogenase nickel incorporation protein HypA/HybF